MKWREIEQKSEEDLQKILKESKAELVDLRFKAATGALKQVHKIKQARKKIARIITKLSTIKK